MTDPRLVDITDRIIERSRATRAAYLERVARMRSNGPARKRLSCGNLAHGFAACGQEDKHALAEGDAPNLGVVSAYNEMLSAHVPYGTYLEPIKKAAHGIGMTAQFAGGVPAMCDGVTQGRDGMDMSLFSRDVIAMATAVALSHDMFDVPGNLRQDRTGPVDRRLVVRPVADHIYSRRANDPGPAQRGKSACAPAVC